jgi:hypothetical protein
LLHAFLGNVMVSAAEGCSFDRVQFAPEGRNFVDVTLDPADPLHAWVLTSGLNGRLQTGLLDVSASSVLPFVVADDFVPSTFEVARSRPERMYVVGFDRSFQSTLLVSDDRGQSWSARPIQPYPSLPMFLSAIDPFDPDILYVRVREGTSDHLIVSRDAGQTFSKVFTLAGEMLGFALSPDGSRVAVGGPGAGFWVASTADFAFSPGAAISSLRCLTWAEAGLYACAQESLDNWTVALSTNSGQSFAPLWHVQDLEPLDCDASSTAGAACPRAWLDVSAQIGADLVPDGVPNSGMPPAAAKDGGSCAALPAPTSRSREALGLFAFALSATAVRSALRRRRLSHAGS